jgi:hypothetical protein
LISFLTSINSNSTSANVIPKPLVSTVIVQPWSPDSTFSLHQAPNIFIRRVLAQVPIGQANCFSTTSTNPISCKYCLYCGTLRKSLPSAIHPFLMRSIHLLNAVPGIESSIQRDGITMSWTSSQPPGRRVLKADWKTVTCDLKHHASVRPWMYSNLYEKAHSSSASSISKWQLGGTLLRVSGKELTMEGELTTQVG